MRCLLNIEENEKEGDEGWDGHENNKDDSPLRDYVIETGDEDCAECEGELYGDGVLLALFVR